MWSLYYWVCRSLDIPDRGCLGGGQDSADTCKAHFFPTALSADVCYKHVGILPAEEEPNRSSSVLSKRGDSSQGVQGALCCPPTPVLLCTSLTFSSFYKGGGLPCFSLNWFSLIYWTKVNNTEKRQLPSWRKTGNVFHSGCTILYSHQKFHFFHMLTNISVFFFSP